MLFIKQLFAFLKDPTNTQSGVDFVSNVAMQDNFATNFIKKMISFDDSTMQLLMKPNFKEYILQPLNIEYLKTLPKNTLGFQYANQMIQNNFQELSYSAEFNPLKDIYVRYAANFLKFHEVHHILLGIPFSVVGEFVIIDFFSHKDIKGLPLRTFAFLTQASFYISHIHKPQQILKFWKLINRLKQKVEITAILTSINMVELLETDTDEVRKQLRIVPFGDEDFAIFSK